MTAVLDHGIYRSQNAKQPKPYRTQASVDNLWTKKNKDLNFIRVQTKLKHTSNLEKGVWIA